MMYITGGTILLLGLVTPINDLYTIPLAGALIIGGYMIGRPKAEEEKELQEIEEELHTDELKSPESVVNLLNVDPIEFEFGYGLIPLADTNQGGDLLDRDVMIRRQLAIE